MCSVARWLPAGLCCVHPVNRTIRPDPTPDPATEVKGAEPAHCVAMPNAPVTLEEFGDFQCPTCGSYYPEVKKIER
jgi:protein-disulfide isomerase